MPSNNIYTKEPCHNRKVPLFYLEEVHVSLTNFHATTFQNMFVEEYQAANAKKTNRTGGLLCRYYA